MKYCIFTLLSYICIIFTQAFTYNFCVTILGYPQVLMPRVLGWYMVCLAILGNYQLVVSIPTLQKNIAWEYEQQIANLELKKEIRCPEIDWTFHQTPPFLHQALLPLCGDVIQPQ